MKLTKDQVRKVAKLANLPISEPEEEKYAQQLSKILDYIEQLKKVDTQKVEPTYNVSALSNVMAPDIVTNSLPQEGALKNSSHAREGYFVTKGVFEE